MKPLFICAADAIISCPPACPLVQEERRHVFPILGAKAKTTEMQQNANTELFANTHMRVK